MARSIWKGSISFGLVNIPVSLTAAESRPDIQLHMVDSKNHARIRYERVNADTGEEVPWDRLVKGYEHEVGQFILLIKAVAREVDAFNPSRLVITSSKQKRKGTIFIDWMRNGEGSTCIAPWSLRARDGAAVSMPVNWSDLATTTADGFTIHEPLRPPVEWIEPEPQLIPKPRTSTSIGRRWFTM